MKQSQAERRLRRNFTNGLSDAKLRLLSSLPKKRQKRETDDVSPLESVAARSTMEPVEAPTEKKDAATTTPF